MRVLTLALSATTVAVAGWSGVAAASAATKCGDLAGAEEPGQICHIQTIDPAYTLDISYPELYPDPKAVIAYVTQTRDAFLNVAKSPAPRDMPYTLAVTETEYNSAVPPRGTQSVVFKAVQDVGGAHPETTYNSFNFDQGYRKPITFDNLFSPGTQPLAVIFPIVQSELQKQTGLTNPVQPVDGLDPSKYENFAITNDTVIFFFSQGELLPESAGALQVSVPRPAIDSMIA